MGVFSDVWGQGREGCQARSQRASAQDVERYIRIVRSILNMPEEKPLQDGRLRTRLSRRWQKAMEERAALLAVGWQDRARRQIFGNKLSVRSMVGHEGSQVRLQRANAQDVARSTRILRSIRGIHGGGRAANDGRFVRQKTRAWVSRESTRATDWLAVCCPCAFARKKTGSVVGSTVHVLSVHLFGQQSLCSQCVWASCLQLCLHGSLWVYSLSLFSSCPAADPPSLSAVLIRLSTRRRVAPRQEPWTGSTCPQPGEKGAEGKTDASMHQHGHLLFCRKKPMISQVRRALFL